VSKRLPELLTEVTLLGFIGNDQIAEGQLKKTSTEEIAQWFSLYVNEKALLCDWLGLNFETKKRE
jgi:hypothetical protein